MVNSILSSLLSPTPACFHGLFGFGVFLVMRFCALFNPQIATRHYSLYSTPNTSVFLHNCTVKPPKNSNILVDLWCLKKSFKKILLKLGSSWKLFFFFSMVTNEELFTSESTEICSHIQKNTTCDCGLLTPFWRKRNRACGRNHW